MADTPIILQTGRQPGYSIIWLHGLGADGYDFVPVAEALQLPAAVRYVFPHAPMRPVTINGGFVMRAWYDIAQSSIAAVLPDSDAYQDASGIRESQAIVENLIARERAQGVEPGNIFLAGFSQGGAIALHTALRYEVALGGVLALSTYLPLAGSVPEEMLPATRETPVFMAHGRSDPVIPCALGSASRQRLTELGYTVAWHEYPMQHSVCDAELGDIGNWLAGRMQESPSRPAA